MIARVKKYFQEIRIEWEKVSKPDWKDVRGNTFIVIVACAILGFFLWLVDGNAAYPTWTSELGLILLIVIIPIIPLIAKRFTSKWKVSIPIVILPLAIAVCFRFILEQEIQGFGLSLLRDLFIRR
jgi:preprotein translocase SecE subunit